MEGGVSSAIQVKKKITERGLSRAYTEITEERGDQKMYYNCNCKFLSCFSENGG